ncbi:Solute carrier family 22 member 13 [Aix galericulata]|nr:Solute carrier family 22 member 13 [Aix galericulata]
MAEFGDFISALGEFGLYQKWLVLLLSLPLLLNPFQMIGQVFIVVDVPHYCNTSWIRAVGPNLTEEEQLNLTLPRGADGAYEQCSMYSPVDWDLGSIVAYGLNATEKCSSGWVYPSAQQPSLLTEFDLVCDRKDLTDISQSVYMLGLFLGAMIFGPLSDRIGRRPVLLISIFIQSLFGLGIAFVPHFYVYMALRCIVATAVSGILITALALGTEWVGVSYRPHAVLITHCCSAIGQMILAGLSYGIRNWRLLEIAGSAPMFALFFYIWHDRCRRGFCRAQHISLSHCVLESSSCFASGPQMWPKHSPGKPASRRHLDSHHTSCPLLAGPGCREMGSEDSKQVTGHLLLPSPWQESARWLVTKGKIEEAKKVLQKAASINKRTIPPDLLEQVSGGPSKLKDK